MVIRMTRECERHEGLPAEEVQIRVAGHDVTVDLCDECRKPLMELVALGRPTAQVPVRPANPQPRRQRTMEDRVRGLPPIPDII